MPFFSRLCEAVSSKQDDVEFLEATGGFEAVATFLRWIRGTREEEESPRRDTGGEVIQRRQNSFQEFQASKHSEAVASAQAAAASAANAASSSVASAITAGGTHSRSFSEQYKSDPPFSECHFDDDERDDEHSTRSGHGRDRSFPNGHGYCHHIVDR